MRSQTSLINPRMMNIFFFIFIIALLHVSPCSGDDFHEEFKACGVYYNCGDLVNITYPFWGNERKEFCGRSYFGLNCKDNKTTTIVINDQQFNVLNIYQSNNIMTIARSDLLDDYCLTNDAMETATLDLRLFTYSSNNRNISVWYNCYAERGVMEEFRFECKDGSVNYAFDAEEGVNLSSNIIRGCKVKIEVTVRVKVLEEAKNNRTALVEKGLTLSTGIGIRRRATVEQTPPTRFTVFVQMVEICILTFALLFLEVHLHTVDDHDLYCSFVSQKTSVWKKVAIIGSAALGSIILIIIISIKFIRKSISNKDIIEEIIIGHSIQTPQRYSFSKLKKITNSFKNKLGQGGFSTVYRGKLPSGHDVAVKLLNESRENGQDFINEVVSITRASHINVVTLLGFCYEGKKRALIYEYMPKGSLDKYISPRELVM